MRMAILAGLIVLFAGCGADEQASLSGPLTYERGGGLAGRRDRLVVRPDGSATLTIRDKAKTVKLTVQTATKSIQLSDAELADLERELAKADLTSLPADSTSKTPVPDTFGYRVTYDGTTVTADDPAMPAKLRGLASGLGALVERYDK